MLLNLNILFDNNEIYLYLKNLIFFSLLTNIINSFGMSHFKII